MKDSNAHKESPRIAEAGTGISGPELQGATDRQSRTPRKPTGHLLPRSRAKRIANSKAAITHEDVERIDAVPGVGAKVAERIVRELRDKVGGLNLMPEHVVAASLRTADSAGLRLVLSS